MPTPTPSGTFALPRATRWFAARARNITRHGTVLAVVGVPAFIATLVTLLWFTRAERAALLRLPPAIDTLPLRLATDSAARLLRAAEAALAASRPPRRPQIRYAAAPTSAPTADAVGVDASGQVIAAVGGSGSGIDSVAAPAPQLAILLPDPALAARLRALSERLDRARNAPLPASWRALAADATLAADPRIPPLVDSLTRLEQQRDSARALAGVDPQYLALSGQVSAIGRRIERVADERRQALISAGGRPVSISRRTAADLQARFIADSISRVLLELRRDTVSLLSKELTRRLARTRRDAAVRQAERQRVTRRVELLAPPAAILGASAAVAVTLALLAALLRELNRPRLAGDDEVADATDVPVLLTLRREDVGSDEAIGSAFTQLTFDLEQRLALARELIILSDSQPLAIRTAARLSERAAYAGRMVRVHARATGTAVMTAARTRRGTPTAVQAVQVQPAQIRSMEWADVEPTDTVQHAELSVRAGTLTELEEAISREAGAAIVLLAVRVGDTPTGWVTQAARRVEALAGFPPAGIVLWEAGADDDDPLARALATALLRTGAVDARALSGR